ERVKRNVTFIEPPLVRFGVDPTGRKNAVFDTTAPTETIKHQRVGNQEYPFSVTWCEFEENVKENGIFVVPDNERVNYDTLYSRLKKGEITAESFVGYMVQRKKHNKYEYVEGVTSFSEFVKGLDPLSNQYGQTIEAWVEEGEVRKKEATKHKKKTKNTYAKIHVDSFITA
ncbi:hypothetical protein, partial [Psychromonas sp. Urea-02u-13]|uniref:hypothetical protein n=1 Tax=Psychromonas sp. Urea-02u-13 TaxID=2058326 RepID=UPI000CBCFA58